MALMLDAARYFLIFSFSAAAITMLAFSRDKDCFLPQSACLPFRCYAMASAL